MTSLRRLAADLTAGRTSGRDLVDQALDRIADPAGEGSRAFLTVAADRARAEADAHDRRRVEGGEVAPFAGIPVAIKDLADVAGEVTTAGSVVLAGDAPAGHDAPVVARLRAAGFVPVGRTNMTEFAYSGLGLNEHYPAPAAPWDRTNRHIPGGSSSGTAVAVSDGMVPVGLGTDTGGSCRIPAAYCGIVGFKPTARRIPLDGLVPLSTSLDSVGPLGTTVDCCAIVDDVFAGGDGLVDDVARPAGAVRLARLFDHVFERIDDEVGERFEWALGRLVDAGVLVDDVAFPELNDLPSINRGGGLAAAEAFHYHRRLLAERGDEYDFRVRPRIEAGGLLSAADYIEVGAQRQRLIEVSHRRLDGFDAFVLPTVANLPPTLADFGRPEDPDYLGRYGDKNLLALRNTSVGNFLDACAISIPIAGDAPVGLMLMGTAGRDRELFEIARTVEAVISA